MTSSKIIAGLGFVTLIAACSDGTGPAPAPGKQTLNLSVSAGRSAASAAAPESLTVGGHTLVLTKVELVIAEFQLKRVSTSTDCSSSSTAASSGPGGDDSHPEDDDCEELESGPFLLDLPLGGGVQRVVSVEVDTGTYRRADYRIHKAEDQSADAGFLSQHPDLKGVSVRVTGAYDGKPFVYVTDLTARQRSELVPPLVVAAKGATNFTLVVDIGKWFVTAGGGLVDPVTALKGSPNDNLVRDNIRRSFRCFNDRDRDGHED